MTANHMLSHEMAAVFRPWSWYGDSLEDGRMGGLLRGRQIGKETEGLRRERVRGRQGWRDALRSNGCLETVVKETMSPRVLWHLMCPIFMLIFQKEEVFVDFTFSLPPVAELETDGDRHRGTVNPSNRGSLDFIQYVLQHFNCHKRGHYHTRRSDNCQIIAYVWQLHRSLREIERETRKISYNFFFVTPDHSFKSWQKPSLSVSSCRWLILGFLGRKNPSQ